MKVPRKIVNKTKIDRIRNQQIRDPVVSNLLISGGKEEDHITRMGDERLVKISRDNIPTGRPPGRPKRRWSDLIMD